MLTQIVISNYALINFIEIQFNKGFSIITGETGAGKSIILGALSLILGERADVKSVRDKDKKSVIEASFDVTKYNLADFFQENDLEFEPNNCILRREILPNGRSRAFINDTPVTLSQLRELSLQLVDIHSQHNNLLLAEEYYQLQIIDNIAGNATLLQSYSAAYRDFQKAKSALAEMQSNVSKTKNDEEYLRFQLSQISSLKLIEDEEEALELEQSTLSNVSEIKNSLWEISSLLNNDERGVLSSLKIIFNKLNSLSRIYTPTDEIKNRAESIIIELKDIVSTVDGWNNQLIDNPIELERINDRLNNIFNLKKKHNVSSVEELILIEKNLKDALNQIENYDYNLSELQQDVEAKHSIVKAIAKQLSAKRKETALKFGENLMLMAKPLGMGNLRCNILCEDTDLNANGGDRIQFLFAFNKNQELLPISHTASGGEISRLMLCVKTIIANTMQLPTIIFDEIDTGVSGDIAARMGEMMNNIGEKLQVIVITHLPQVAAMGHYHYKVYKKDTLDSTVSEITELSQEERINEIAAMLSGHHIDDAAINNAKSLLKLKNKK